MLGFAIVLLSSLCFCVQNVIVRVLFNSHSLFGLVQTGGFVTPTLPHSFLLMFLRMLWAVPLMAVLASKLYAPTWSEMQRLCQKEHRSSLGQGLIGGGLMFLYLALLYISVGLLPTGIAMTLFFTYPVFTAFFSWQWFGQRPTGFRWTVMGTVLFGGMLTLPYAAIAPGSQDTMGILTGIGSGIAYALYTTNAQRSLESIHPVPFTWISFTTTLILSAASFPFWQLQAAQLDWQPLWVGALLSALATFGGHLFKNIGIRSIGATPAATISASNPAFTAILAWVAIQEHLNGLQWIGIAIVTLSVALLSQERRFSSRR